MTPGRKKLAVTLAIVLLLLVAAQVVLLVINWTNWDKDVIKVVAIGAQLWAGLTFLVTRAQAIERGNAATHSRSGSHTLPPAPTSANVRSSQDDPHHSAGMF